MYTGQVVLMMYTGWVVPVMYTGQVVLMMYTGWVVLVMYTGQVGWLWTQDRLCGYVPVHRFTHWYTYLCLPDFSVSYRVH